MTLKRLFCLLTFGHSWIAKYGYGCPIQDDITICRKCDQEKI